MSAEEKDEFFDGFAWAIPSAFADSLGTCRFEQGDILYDTKKAYQGTWGESLPHISYSIQIKSPPRGSATKSQKKEKSVFTDYWNQRVIFDLTDHKRRKTQQVTTTQGRLYTLLWTNDVRTLDEETDDPLIPTLATDIVRDLSKTADYFKRTVAQTMDNGTIFLMPYDRSRRLLRVKFSKVTKEFSKRFLNRIVHLVTPEEAGLRSQNGFAPTIRIACFCVANESTSAVKEAVKEALYTPAKEKKTTKKQFRISAHGHLEAL